MKVREKTAYCYECDSDNDFITKTEYKKIYVRGVEVECDILVCYCAKCGNRVLVSSIEKENEIKIYDLYKSKMGLLTSEEIKQILIKRSMSQKELASFLSIGEKDITRYINGAIQSKNIDKILRMVDDDLCFLRMNSLFKKESIHSV